MSAKEKDCRMKIEKPLSALPAQFNLTNISICLFRNQNSNRWINCVYFCLMIRSILNAQKNESIIFEKTEKIFAAKRLPKKKKTTKNNELNWSFVLADFPAKNKINTITINATNKSLDDNLDFWHQFFARKVQQQQHLADSNANWRDFWTFLTGW